MASNIDPEKLAAELKADMDVMRSLRKHGDIASVIRPVDVRFVGQASDIDRLAKAASTIGWEVIQVVALNEGRAALDVQRRQSTEPSALRALTIEALNIEQAYDVGYDGWGAVAVTK
jgi:hypothetical protein